MEEYETISEKIDDFIKFNRRMGKTSEAIRKGLLEYTTRLFAELNERESIRPTINA